jgi:hypothetical protein
MYICRILNGLRDRVISLYISKIVDKKEISRTVTNTGTYHSSEKDETAYLVKYTIFENLTLNFNALCNTRKDMTCRSSVQ